MTIQQTIQNVETTVSSDVGATPFTQSSDVGATPCVAQKAPSDRKFLASLFGAYLATRLPFLFTVPMQQAPDEFAHYWVIKFLTEHWRLPTAPEVFKDGPSAVYGSLPQLGYIPHLFFTALAPAQFLPLAERFGSLACGAVMVWSAWKIGQIIFRSRLLAAAVPLLIVFHPQIAFLHAYANNDSTSSTIASVLLLLSLQTIRDGITVKRSALIGSLVGWLAITKYSGLAVGPAIALAMLSSWFLHGTSWTVVLPSFLVAGTTAVALSAWWFVRTAAEFNGDFMGTKTMYHTWATTFNRDLHYYLSPWKIIKSLAWWRMTFFSFWGLFGYMDKYLWRPVYIAYLFPLIAATAAFVWNGLKGRIKPNRTELAMWSCLALVPLMNIIAMVWASVHNLGGPQGRYLFTSEIPIAALLISGLSLCGETWGKRFVIGFLVFNAITCFGSWLYLFFSYGGFHLSPL